MFRCESISISVIGMGRDPEGPLHAVLTTCPSQLAIVDVNGPGAVGSFAIIQYSTILASLRTNWRGS